MIKFCKTVYIVPKGFVVCMKNMRTVLMDGNTMYIVCIRISGNMLAFVNDQTFLTMLGHALRKRCAKKSCAYNQVIVLDGISPWRF